MAGAGPPWWVVRSGLGSWREMAMGWSAANSRRVASVKRILTIWTDPSPCAMTSRATPVSMGLSGPGCRRQLMRSPALASAAVGACRARRAAEG